MHVADMSNVIHGPWPIHERARALGQHVEYLLHMLKTDNTTRKLMEYYAEKLK